jgi:hypothetical protein
VQLGILGLPKAGKTALFNALTASRQATGKFRASNTTNVGVATVQDRRLEQLRDLYQPKRYVPAQVRFVDVPGIDRGRGEILDLAELRMMDALVHVVRAFEDPELLHPSGSVDPQRDIAAIDLELILADYEVVERRLERLVQAQKRGLTDQEKRERALLSERVLPALEAETSLRRLDFDAEEAKRLRGYGLLSRKPMLVVVNVDEDVAGDPAAAAGVEAPPGTGLLAVSARLEEEISRLDPTDQGDFLAEAGLDQPSAVRVVQAGYELLGLISFFTVGDDEVRAWTLRRGSTAVTAAGAVHSDIERGFIRAEVTGWRELIDAGSLAVCRERATLRLEGKAYPVRDGEVVHFRFNV